MQLVWVVVMMIETDILIGIVPTSMSTLSILSLSNTICNNADHMQWMASPPGSAVEISEGEAEEGAFKARAEESHRGIPPRADDTPATRSPSAGSGGCRKVHAFCLLNISELQRNIGLTGCGLTCVSLPKSTFFFCCC